ncbi:MAG TPA: SMP-30/gluconolactonase/LRE family protein [Acidimicrobiales bacterium]|nr:SMP-30/gluconolactonase/LRE family protein [Acidimicrobiales bacterium]
MVEQLTDPITYHGEGPVWSERWGGLRWVDMLAGDVLSLRVDGSVTRRSVGAIIAALRPRRDGGAVIGVERGFMLESPEGSLIYLGDLWTSTDVRMNDGGCDPDGRFYCGSMAYDVEHGRGALYRLDPDCSLQVVLQHVTISNGIDWSPDGSLAYYVDTPTRRIDVFDYDDHAGLTRRRPFVSVPEDDGAPDGITVDADGGVWVALYGGGAVRRYTPVGVLDDVIDVPARQVTACTFGGRRLDELYITTSRENLDPHDDPLAGSLFRASIGVAGQPVREFAG